jgi:hypothetical protein
VTENNRRLRILLTVLIFVGALYRYWPLDFPLGPCGIGYESLEIACSLAHKASFSDPFATLPTGPSAHLAPLFPMLVSVLIKWFGDGPASMNAVQWLGTFVAALQFSLWPWFAERLGMRFISGLLGAAAAIYAGYAILPYWEAAYVALLLLILIACMHRILAERVTTQFVGLTGALWGITFLLNPVPLLAYAALTVWVACIKRIPRIQKLVLAIVPFVVISPWLVRNFQVFHHVVLIRDNLGTELWNSNNSCATFSFRDNRSTNCFDHPNEIVAEAQLVRSMGEYAYNQAKLREALAWMGSNPRQFANLTKLRFLAFWFATPNGINFAGRRIPANILIVWLVMPLSIGGLYLLMKSDRNAAGICLAILALFPPIYYFVQFVPRYRVPILWASFLPASFFLVEAA